MSKHTEKVPLCILDGSDGELLVTFNFSPGAPACGPTYYHGGLPADPPEIEIVSAMYLNDAGKPLAPCGLADHEEEKVVEWLFENWEEPGPDPDDARDRWLDDQIEGWPI